MHNHVIHIGEGDDRADWIKLANKKATREDREIHVELGKKYREEESENKNA